MKMWSVYQDVNVQFSKLFKTAKRWWINEGYPAIIGVCYLSTFSCSVERVNHGIFSPLSNISAHTDHAGLLVNIKPRDILAE